MPNWESGIDGCPPFMCTCANHCTKLGQPRVTNIGRDPRELSPLDPESETYKSVVEMAEKAVEDHMKTRTQVPLQMTLDFRFRLQPCCSWKFCMCSKDDSNALEYVAPWDR